jgi:hypothetical protein
MPGCARLGCAQAAIVDLALVEIKGRAPPGQSARVLASLRAAPPSTVAEMARKSGVPGQLFFSSWANITMMPLGPRT